MQMKPTGLFWSAETETESERMEKIACFSLVEMFYSNERRFQTAQRQW